MLALPLWCFRNSASNPYGRVVVAGRIGGEAVAANSGCFLHPMVLVVIASQPMAVLLNPVVVL